jgi:hypothetical protein
MLFAALGIFHANYGSRLKRSLYSPGLRMAYALPRNASAF